MSGTYGKDNKPKSLIWGAKWPTLGNIATSSFTPEESPDPKRCQSYYERWRSVIFKYFQT